MQFEILDLGPTVLMLHTAATVFLNTIIPIKYPTASRYAFPTTAAAFPAWQ
jgi:hypothetical protein